jgi:hypothetical protein
MAHIRHLPFNTSRFHKRLKVEPGSRNHELVCARALTVVEVVDPEFVVSVRPEIPLIQNHRHGRTILLERELYAIPVSP